MLNAGSAHRERVDNDRRHIPPDGKAYKGRVVIGRIVPRSSDLRLGCAVLYLNGAAGFWFCTIGAAVEGLYIRGMSVFPDSQHICS